ncbi:MAG: C25 family cysteine peptidase [candidate division WOR-3 bacterium]
MIFFIFNLTLYYNENVIKKLPIIFEEGYPILPYDFRLIEIPHNAQNVKIKTISTTKTLYKTNVILEYNDKFQYIDETGNLKTIQIPRINIGNKFPTSPVEIKNVGYMRDKKYALVFIYPLTYENGNLYLNQNINFEIEYELSQTTYNIKPLPDSIDYLILTISQFKEPFDSIAQLSRIRGYRTIVFYVDSIKDNPEKIRNLIIWAYRTLGIKYVLIGADATIIKPWRFQLRFYESDQNLPTGPDVHTDYPYSALDGDYKNNIRWNLGDSIIDAIPDVGIARLPATNSYDVFNYYYKLKDWTFNFSGNTGAFACLESEIQYGYFGGYCSQIVQSSNMPRIIELYEPYFNGNLTPQILFDSLNLNKPQFFFYIGHANGFIIASSYANPSIYVYTTDFYNLSSNYNAPYIAMFGGCWTGDLEHIAILKNILLMPGRGAIFSIGASKLDNTGSETARGKNFFYAFNSFNAKNLGDAYITMAIAFSSSLFSVYSKLNMFGDPTIEPYLNGKNYISANHPSSFSDSLVINTIPNARVLLYDGEFYAYTLSDNNGRAVLRYSNSSPKTLLLSISKPSYVPYYSYINYYPSNVVLDSISLNADYIVPSNSYDIKFYLTNISSNNINTELKVKFTNANPDSIVQNLSFNPSESKTINSNITIRPNAKNLIIKIYLDNKLIRSFSYSVEPVKLKLVGVRWETDSILFDIYNASNVPVYNIKMEFPQFSIFKMIDSIPSNSNTNYTTKLPRVSNNPVFILAYNSKQDTYNLNFQFPLLEPTFYLFPHREGILIKFDTTDNSSVFYKIYRSDNPNGNYKFIAITNQFSKVYLDIVDSFKVYYYKISRIDSYYNEGKISNYKAQSKNPNYSIYKPTYLPQQGEAPVLIGKFDKNDPNKQIFMISPILASFYNYQGIPLNNYPKELWFRGLSGAVGDIDGDGEDEAIVSAMKDGKGFILSFKLNKLDTIFMSDFWGDVSIYNKGLILANFVGDSLPEIALKTYYSDGSNHPQRIIIIDPRTKAIINEFKYFKGNFSVNWDISASDFDNDSLYEIVFLDSLALLHIKKYNGQELNNFPIDLKPYLPYQDLNNYPIGQFSSVIYVTQNKIICGLNQVGNLLIFVINANNGNIELVLNVNSFIGGNPIGEFGLSLGNVDNDNIPEIVLLTSHNYYPSRRIFVIKLNSQLLAQFVGPDKDWTWYSPVSIADLGNDNNIDLIVSLPRRIFLLTYKNNSLIEYPGSPIILADDTLPEGFPYYSPIFEDINNDNIPEMFILQHSHPLYSFNVGQVGKIEWNGNRANFRNTAEYGDKTTQSAEEIQNTFVKFNYKYFSIEFNLNKMQEYKLRIFDVSGRVVYDQKSYIKGKGYLDLKNVNLRNGVYIVDFRTDGFKKRWKVLKR